MDIFGLPTMNSWIAYIPYGYYFLSKGGQLLTNKRNTNAHFSCSTCMDLMIN
jgi:hypothetical protein